MLNLQISMLSNFSTYMTNFIGQHKEAYFAMCQAVLKKWKLAGSRPLNANPVDNKSGIWLFQDRTKPTHFFPPNFLPPYDTEEKKQIILSYLTEEWDEQTLS